MYSKILCLLLLVVLLIIPVSAYVWEPKDIAETNLGSNYYLTFNGSKSLFVPGSLTTTFDGANSSGLYVGTLSGSCYGFLKDGINASHLVMSEVTVSYSVNTTNKYYSSGSITYDIYNIRESNVSTLDGAAYYTLQTSFVPSTCDIGVQKGFKLVGPDTKPRPYVSLPGFIYAGEATYALPNIIDDIFGNGTAAYGTVATTVYATDGDTGNIIVGATLNIKDVENSSWVNATSTAVGIPINVLASHTLDIYGDYPGVYNASQELGATPGGNYYLPLFRYNPAPVGYINLYVTPRDTATGLAIKYSPVSVRVGTATEGSSSGSSGTASFTVPNNTVVVYSASPAGYNSLSLSTTMGIVDKHVYIDLTRATVPTSTTTPTVTNPATGEVITAQPTYLQYCNPSAADYSASLCSQSQDSDLMATLRIWAPSLLMLMILAWCFGLLKMIMKW